RITPSVAEQEGQQTETEATGAPQKHHYTLNQQVGSITLIRTFLNKAISVLPLSINAKCSPGKSVADKAYLFAVDLHFPPFPLIIR
ncbi:hypothetical protein Q2T74_28105, partial [Klebsiella variicola]|uniref:hypothetical protein n=1 Tax=Klebsiella variicola TaxID=244366 RepID=UPI00265F0E6D